jgi:hypothetical protein
LIGQPRGVAGFGVASPFAVSRATAAVTSVPANAPRMKEPAPSRTWKMLSATIGESPCCLMIALLMPEFLPVFGLDREAWCTRSLLDHVFHLEKANEGPAGAFDPVLLS